MVEIGDIFLIPFEDRYAVCKIIWISKRTKNVFSFIVKDELASTTEEALKIAHTKNNISIQVFTGMINVFYTDITKLKKGEWRIIEKERLKDEECERFQYHNIGGKLFKGDEEIRPLNNEEIKTIPKMLNAGYEAINNFLKIAFS